MKFFQTIRGSYISRWHDIEELPGLMEGRLQVGYYTDRRHIPAVVPYRQIRGLKTTFVDGPPHRLKESGEVDYPVQAIRRGKCLLPY